MKNGLDPQRGPNETYEMFCERRRNGNKFVKLYLRLGTPVYEMKYVKDVNGNVKGVPYVKPKPEATAS